MSPKPKSRDTTPIVARAPEGPLRHFARAPEGALRHGVVGAAPADAPKTDVMVVHGVSEDGKSLAVLRARDDKIEAGVVRAVGEGEAVHGELVRLTPRPACPAICDVEVTVPRGTLNAPGGRDTAEPARRAGPAQVATEQYRDNWEAIWRRPGRREQKEAIPRAHERKKGELPN